MKNTPTRLSNEEPVTRPVNRSVRTKSSADVIVRTTEDIQFSQNEVTGLNDPVVRVISTIGMVAAAALLKTYSRAFLRTLLNRDSQENAESRNLEEGRLVEVSQALKPMEVAEISENLEERLLSLNADLEVGLQNQNNQLTLTVDNSSSAVAPVNLPRLAKPLSLQLARF